MSSVAVQPGVARVSFSIPALQHAGRYRVEAENLANSADQSGKRDMRKVPLACDAGLVQPPKSLACRLLVIELGYEGLV